MATKIIRVLAAGKMEAMGRRVIEGLKPEVEVVHFMLSTHIADELPLILENKIPPNPSSNVAAEILGGPVSLSEKPAQALILGGAYTDEIIAELRALVEEKQAAAAQEGRTIRQIPWIRIDSAKSKFPPSEPDVYVPDVIARCKAELFKLDGEGKLDGSDGEVYAV
ncbi:hypothetical protein V8F33_005831 [Rhypophila sp. PSN 637]